MADTDETVSILGEMTEREYEALQTLRRLAADGHPYLSSLARQKERELLDLAVTQGGATAVEPREEPPKPALPPARRVVQRKAKVRIDNGWLRALERLKQ